MSDVGCQNMGNYGCVLILNPDNYRDGCSILVFLLLARVSLLVTNYPQTSGLNMGIYGYFKEIFVRHSSASCSLNRTYRLIQKYEKSAAIS
jgi:hypothetical protein